MEMKRIILESYSMSDLSIKIFGRSNGRYKLKVLDILEKNGFDESVFEGKNKNSKHEKIFKKCPVCGTEFQTLSGIKREKNSCSVSCSNVLSPKRKRDPLLPIKRVRDKRIKTKIEKNCSNCNRVFMGYLNTKNCSKECTNEHMKNIMIEKVKNGDHSGWTTRKISSYPEDFFKKVLDNMEVKYEFNYPISKYLLGIKCKSCYFLDFYIEINGKKIDLEIDGKQHEYPERRESDLLRDDILKKNDFIVYRIKWKNPINEKNKSHMKEEIEKLKYLLHGPVA